MPLPLRLVTAVVVLVAVFGGAAAAGSAFGPDRKDAADRRESPHGGGMAMDAHGDAPHGAGHRAAQGVRGLSVAEGGLRLVNETGSARPGEATELRFRIADGDGGTVRDFAVGHTKRMHVIVVRRDLTGFRHLHPRQAADGSWRVRWTPPAAGSYRLYADFRRGGEDRTLATDLAVDGAARMTPLPDASRTATATGGYRVRLAEGAGDALRFRVTRAGREVHPQPYLGAGGHLVALREADGAFLHVHPVEHGEGGHRPGIEFETAFPTAGAYRLFLQFKDEGRVHTAAFTKEVR